MEPYLPSARSGPALRSDERIGDEERSLACEQLSGAFALGRLSDEEIEDRLARAVNARTRQDVQLLTRDLGPYVAASRSDVRRDRSAWRGADVLAAILLIGCTLSISAIMLLLAGVSPVYFLCAVLGGNLAFVAGVSASQLVHRSLGRARAASEAGS